MLSTLLVAAAAVALLAGAATAIRILMGPDPPPEPRTHLTDEPDRDALFRPVAWKKRFHAGGRLPGEFHRPLEVDDEEGLLPPPRQIRGVNDE